MLFLYFKKINGLERLFSGAGARALYAGVLDSVPGTAWPPRTWGVTQNRTGCNPK